MNKKEQKQFVRELMDDVLLDIYQKIDDNKIPEGWDGIELRWLLRERFADCVWDGIDQNNKKRKRNFNNTVLVNNL